MSRRNLHLDFTGSASDQQAAARHELGQALADDSTIQDNTYVGGGGQNDHTTTTTSFLSNSADGTMSNNASAPDDDPARLFGILEEGLRLMPKQGEAGGPSSNAELQKRRDLAEHTWDFVRRWMWAHPQPEQRQAAAFIRGQHDATPLHLMCKLPNPPPDVIAALVESAPEIASWTDSHGWLPLHHACTNGASPEVLQILIQAYPAGKLQQDNQMRTPLHFYATRNFSNPAQMAMNAELLSDTGAAALCDRGGMYPIHYACAYGTDPAVLEVLTRVHPESLTAKENKGKVFIRENVEPSFGWKIITRRRFVLPIPHFTNFDVSFAGQ